MRGAHDGGVLEAVRRFTVGLLFGVHTYRFKIYLGPDRGLRTSDCRALPEDGGLGEQIQPIGVRQCQAQ